VFKQLISRGFKIAKARNKDNTKQTPSNTICSNSSQAGWGSDGKVHCFNAPSGNRGNTSSYPSCGSHGNSDHGGHEPRNSINNNNNYNTHSTFDEHKKEVVNIVPPANQKKGLFNKLAEHYAKEAGLVDAFLTHTQQQKLVSTLINHSQDYNSFHKEISSANIPMKGLNTLSLRGVESIDSQVVNLVFDLLKTNDLPRLKTLDLSDNPKSIGREQIDKLSDAFLSGNCKIETLDISCYIIAPININMSSLPLYLPSIMKNKYDLNHIRESLGRDAMVYHDGEPLKQSFQKLILSVSTCAQPLCITIDSHTPISPKTAKKIY